MWTFEINIAKLRDLMLAKNGLFSLSTTHDTEHLSVRFSMRTVNIFFIASLLLISACNRDGPLLVDVPTKEISKRLDNAIPTLMKDNNVAGLSIVVIRGGIPAITRSYGYTHADADSEPKRRIDEKTVFRAASLGKPVFAYIVVSLARRQKLI